MKNMTTILFLVVSFVGLGLVGGISGKYETWEGNRNTQSIDLVTYAKRSLQGFEMRVWISNQMAMGQQAWDGLIQGQSPPYGLEYPIGSGVEHLHGAGPWIGGILDGVRRVSEGYNPDNAAKYIRPDFRHPYRDLIWHTSVGDSLTEPNRRGCDDDGDGLIDEDDLDGMDNDGDWVLASDDIGSDGVPDIYEVGCKGSYDSSSNPDPYFDNYAPGKIDSCHPIDHIYYRMQDDPYLYTENNGMPDHGEPHVDEDYAAISDNDLYCSARDDNDPPAGHFPMGIQVIQKSYAWNTDKPIIPFEYYFINMSGKAISDVWIGFLADPDVGPVSAGSYWTHNYSCHIDSLHTAYAHNPIDRGSTPVGVTFLGSSKPADSLKYIFKWFNFTTRPGPGLVDSILYGWMSGEYFPDQLVDTCESSTNPSDTRFLISVGPFETFAPGETLKLSLALISGDSIADGPNSLIVNAGSAIEMFNSGILTDVENIKDESYPREFSLSWNYPNPFNPVTSIQYSIPERSWVKIHIFNILGQVVGTLVDGDQQPGYKTVRWDASRLPSGVYFYRLTAGSFTETRKMLLIR